MEKILLNEIGKEISIRLRMPDNPLCLCLFGHGAGAGIDHDFIVNIQEALFKRNIATFTFNFVYKEQGKKLPTSKKAVDNEYRTVWKYVSDKYSDLQLFAGGKSMGGRVSTRVVYDLFNIRGLIFLGFPIHSPGKPDKVVGDYIKAITTPMLFLQGSKDPFGTKEVAEKLIKEIPNAKLYWLDGGKHSWETTKKNTKSQSQLMEEACDQIVEFCKYNLK